MERNSRRHFRRLIYLVLIEKLFLFSVESEIDSRGAVQTTTEAMNNVSINPLFILRQIKPVEERFDLTPPPALRETQESVAQPPGIPEKGIGVATGSDGQPMEEVTADASTMLPPKFTTQTASWIEPPPIHWQEPQLEINDIFTGIGDASWTLEEKIIDIENKVCRSGCGNLMSEAYFPNVPSDCHSCHCDKTCITYHTCCPDLVLRKQVSFDDLRSDCLELTPTGFNQSDVTKLPSSTSFSSMITKCQASIIPDSDPIFLEQMQDANRKCHDPDTSKPDGMVPVSDKSTDLTYRNIHCARCNKVKESSLVLWEAEIICSGNLDLLLESNPNKTELYRRLSSKDEVARTGCRIFYQPIQKDFRRKCRYRLEPVIESCNVTGQWPKMNYNADIEKACLLSSYVSLFQNKYKNMFCFLCNVDAGYDYEGMQSVVHGGDSAHTARLSFSALINFDDSNGEEAVEKERRPVCDNSQIFDNLTCSCRDIKCSYGKEFIPMENECQSFVRSNNIGYRACARLDIQTYAATTLDDFERLFRQTYIFEAEYEWNMTVSRWCAGARDFTIHLEIFEIRPFEFGPPESLETRLREIPARICGALSHEMALGQLDACLGQYVESCPELKGYSLPCSRDSKLRIPQRQITGNHVVPAEDIIKKTTFMPYRETNQCPFVEISVAEFNASEGSLTHVTSGQRISVSKADYIENDTKIRLCLKEFLNWTQGNAPPCEKNREDDDSFDTWTISGLISILCSCISLLFLFLTFLTYILFDQLRSGGGKNIMVLTATLFVSQALYEFAIEQYENRYLCTAIGISIHFFWMAAVFSMNACTWERFYKLCFPLKSRSFFMSEKPFLIATMYTFSCPLLIVICNISANIAINQHVGYGNSRLCYINERYSRIFSFVVPLCVIVVVNVVLLIFTICKLRKQSLPGDRKTSQTRIGLVACVRLSVVTGFTWLVALLYEAVPVEAMGHIFTALLGLQGVVFFFSIVVNKKALDMYRKRFPCRSTQHSSSGSGSKTTALSKTSEEQNNTDTFPDVLIEGKNFTHFVARHVDVSRLSSGDSGFDLDIGERESNKGEL